MAGRLDSPRHNFVCTHLLSLVQRFSRSPGSFSHLVPFILLCIVSLYSPSQRVCSFPFYFSSTYLFPRTFLHVHPNIPFSCMRPTFSEGKPSNVNKRSYPPVCPGFIFPPVRFPVCVNKGSVIFADGSARLARTREVLSPRETRLGPEGREEEEGVRSCGLRRGPRRYGDGCWTVGRRGERLKGG